MQRLEIQRSNFNSYLTPRVSSPKAAAPNPQRTQHLRSKPQESTLQRLNPLRFKLQRTKGFLTAKTLKGWKVHRALLLDVAAREEGMQRRLLGAGRWVEAPE